MVQATPIIFFPQAALFAVTHYLALQFFLYYYLPWFDVMMHTWGGYLVVLGLLMIGDTGSRRLRFGPLWIGLLLIAVMTAWEVFEYAIGLSGGRPDFVNDTILDYVCGAIGGVVAYIIHRKT